MWPDLTMTQEAIASEIMLSAKLSAPAWFAVDNYTADIAVR